VFSKIGHTVSLVRLTSHDVPGRDARPGDGGLDGGVLAALKRPAPVDGGGGRRRTGRARLLHVGRVDGRV
jgi:hypothetical protein